MDEEPITRKSCELPPKTPFYFALAGLACPIAAWVSQLPFALGMEPRLPAEVYLLQACFQGLLLLAGVVFCLLALGRTPRTSRVILLAVLGLLLSVGTLGIAGFFILKGIVFMP